MDTKDVYYNADYYSMAMEHTTGLSNEMDYVSQVIQTFINNCSNLEGYEIEKEFDYLEVIQQKKEDISDMIHNIELVKYVGDSINNDSADGLLSTFSSSSEFLAFMRNIGQGKLTMSDIEQSFNLPFLVDYSQIIEDGFTVQGYTIIDNYAGGNNTFGNNVVVISAYSKTDNSRLYFYDKSTGKLVARVVLTNHDHVGGASFDPDNQLLWVTGSDGKIHTYDYQALSEAVQLFGDAKDGEYLSIDFNDRNVSDNLRGHVIEIPNNICAADSEHNGMDSVYYYNGKIYSCQYSSDGALFQFDLNINRDPATGKIISISGDQQQIGTLNGATQGLVFYQEDGHTYVVSASSSLYSYSRLTRWELTEDGLVEKGRYYYPQAGLEGIEIRQGQITGIFESGTPSVENFGNVNEINWDYAATPENAETATDNDGFLTFAGWSWDNFIEAPIDVDGVEGGS